MADQDFNIKVVTTADTTGLRQTREEIERVRQAAEKVRQDAGAKALFAREAAIAPIAPTQAGANAGITGTAIGLGTIVTLLTASLSKWREFNAEQDKWVDGMIKSQEKSRELGLAVADMLDAMKSAERIDTEPLQVSFDRLKQKVVELKEEMKLAFASGEYEDVKRYASALGVVESQLHRVTSALDQKAKASAKAAEEAEKDAEASAREAQDFMTKAVATSSAQTKAILANEEQARQARERGDEKQADQFQKTAEQLKKSATPEQISEYEGLNQPVRLGPKAGPGESQSAIDDIARNQINFQRQLKGEPPLPTGAPQGNQGLIDAIHELRDLWK